MDNFWVKVKINKVLYSKTEDNFFIALADVIEAEVIPFYKAIKIKGNFDMLFEGDLIKITGNFTIGKNSENIFFVTSYALIIQQEESSIIKFFQQEKLGIRKSYITSLIKKIGIDFISALYNDNSLIDRFDFSNSAKSNIIKVINRRIVYQEIINFLILNNISPKYANQIFKKYGDNSIKAINENPYTMYYSAEIPFDRLDKLAYSLKMPYDFFGRIDVGIFYFIDLNMDSRSHVYVLKSEIIEKLPTLLKNSMFPEIISESQIEKVLAHLINKDMLTEVEHNGVSCIYKKFIYNRQNFIIEKLNKKIAIECDIDEYRLNCFLDNTPLSDEQKSAICISLKNKISIITGGPGTGKTFVLKYLYESIKFLNPDANILVLAPTGRASRRIEEVLQKNASTIHRGLGLQFTKEIKDDDFLHEDYIIVDESSMIDLIVFYSLIKAMPVESNLILVGDSDQLPSIGIGLVFSDLIDSKKIPTSRLIQIFRQNDESLIAHNSRLYIEGKMKEGDFLNGGKGFYFLNKADEEIYKFLWKSVDKLLRSYSLKDIMILTPIKNEFLGTYEINAQFQERYNQNAILENTKKIKFSNILFVEGDRVIHKKNNYSKGIMNGCIGIIRRIDEENKIIDVDYGDSRFVSYAESELDEMDLAYACTIHKAQGSEFPVIIFISSNSMDYGINRNSIYTAWTRAKDMVITIGSFAKVIESWQICERNNRNSYLSKLL